MAEQIPYGVVVSFINRLASSAFREMGQIYGVMDELEKLKETVESIKAVLLDAEEKQQRSHAVKIWISRLNKVLHDADDLFDDFVTEDLQRKVDSHGKIVREVRDFFSSSNRIVFRSKMAHKIKEIQKKFNDVAKDMSNLNFHQSFLVMKKLESGWRETSSFLLQSDIIGRDKIKNEITDLLFQTHNNQNISLVAIVGIGGLGKTALAQLVYNDYKVVKFFHKRIWVSVSEDFEVKTLVKKMLESLTKEKVGDLQLETMQNQLQESINGQRYLLVLDGVWNENSEKWNHLRNYLMCGAQGSKILVTTRNGVAALMMGVNNPYVLKGLTKEDSWVLFKKLAFGEDARRMSQNLISIGEKISEKCRGVPLAIRTVGSLLQSKNEEREWLSILDGDIWRLCEENDSMMPVLKLSYQNLPLALRQCFIYCSLYPKGIQIRKDKLIQLWMAQGYLECSNEEQCMEDIGNQYVNILLMRSFFQDVEINAYGDIFRFKMHDLMHDLAQSIASTDCCLTSEGKRIAGRPTHISFESSGICSLDSWDANRLRTILLPLEEWQTKVRSINNLSLISNFKCLRVLDLSSSSISKLPESMGKLKHLRYLDLSRCKELTSLPKTISNLVNLQTLKLSDCKKLEFSVEVITKLISLRHLVIDNCKAFTCKMPIGLGKLKSLQHLSNFVVGDRVAEKGRGAKLNELKDLSYLRDHLTIENLKLVRDVASESDEVDLNAKKNLQSLYLNWCWEKDSVKFDCYTSDSLQLLDNLRPHQNLKEIKVWGYPGVRFSNWFSSLTNTVKISLISCDNCRYLPPLEQLPSLKYLKLLKMQSLECIYYEWCEEVSSSASFFPSLETLEIKLCRNLKGWQKMENVNEIDIDELQHHQQHLLLPPFPCLSHLEILNCPNLIYMPPYPHLAKRLELRASCVKPLIDTVEMKMKIGESTAAQEYHEPKPNAVTTSWFWFKSPSFAPLSTLKSMLIQNIDMEALPADWMRNLTSLQHLSIQRFPSLALVFRDMQHLPAALEELQIWNMNKIEFEDANVNIFTRRQPLRCLYSLQTIEISSCSKLKAMPEWICNLPSLQHMIIRDCHDLESLPEGMHRLTNLQTLLIRSCPLLSERCQREKGADWLKIAHIPDIYCHYHKI